MTDFTQALGISASGMTAQTARIGRLSENIANADTPGYHRKLVSFDAEVQRGQQTGRIEVGRTSLDQSPLSQIYDPSHPLADETGHYNGSNVDLLVEIADAREAQRSYEANLKMFEQIKQMSSGLLDLLRR